MKTQHNTRQTSIWAFQSLTDLTARQTQVYDLISRYGVVCNAQIAIALQVPINSITPRTNELVAKGVVTEAFKAKWEPTNKTVIYWRIK
jgi:hypothetical protein